MRNLRNIQRSTVRFSDCELPLAATTWDTANDSLICAFGPTETNVLIELRRVKYHPTKDETHQLIASWDAPCPHPDLPCDLILSLHYFADTAITCLIMAGGDIVIVREEPLPGEDLLEIVGSVDAGILGAAWSPDEELLAICTKADTLLFMSRDFENIADIELSPEDVKASNHVSVGWGKVETQFKGKRARALRDPTMPEKVDEGFLSKHDDGRTRISWRGDGAYVAVNSVEEEKRRMIRIYSREGTLDSVSEPVDNLEGPLSWRPAGNLIAGVRRQEDKTEVVFFERNGLRHGEFNLRLTMAEMEDWGSVTNLCWNIDSTVLAVCFVDRIQLWTMGNYHYYLKQGIRLSRPVSPIKGMCWHPEKSLRFAGHSQGKTDP
jgi:elongator complex protein 1